MFVIFSPIVFLIWVLSIIIIKEISKTKFWLSGGYLIPIILIVILYFAIPLNDERSLVYLLTFFLFGPLAISFGALTGFMFLGGVKHPLIYFMQAMFFLFGGILCWGSFITIGYKILQSIKLKIYKHHNRK